MENLITNRFHGKLIAMVCWKKRTIWSDDFPWFSHCNAHLVGGFPRISQPCLMTGGGLHHRLRKVHILYTSPTFVDCIPMCPQVALRYPAWHIYIYIYIYIHMLYCFMCIYMYIYIYYTYIYMTFNVHQLLHRNADSNTLLTGFLPGFGRWMSVVLTFFDESKIPLISFRGKHG